MPIEILDGKIFIEYGNIPANKYKPLITKELKTKFGSGPFSIEQVNEALKFTLDWHINSFLQILNNETEVRFYQGLFMLHEFSCQFHQEAPHQSPIPQAKNFSFPAYRRTLKLSLEHACELMLTGQKTLTRSYLRSREATINELLYLGDHIYFYSNSIAEQHILGDCKDLVFGLDGFYEFEHKRHYGFLFDKIQKLHAEHIQKAVTGKADLDDFISASILCLGIDPIKAFGIVAQIHESFEGGRLALYEWEIFTQNYAKAFNSPYNKTETFYKGLTLTKDNKLSINDLVHRSHKTDKFLNRPILVWNVDGKDLAIVGEYAFSESITNLTTNCFGWGYYPLEWENDCFKSFIKEQCMQNDKILEDASEKLLKGRSIIYDRDIKNLKKWNNQHHNIEIQECGQLDFIFLFESKIYIAECKHQIGRYDMNNFRHDYEYFEKGSKKKPSFNETLKKKLSFLSSRTHEIEEHFQVKFNDRNFKLDTITVEGIFIVNTPTFIMYNNKYRIYTIKAFEDLIGGEFVDPIYQVEVKNGDEKHIVSVEYPYFTN